MAHQFAHVQTHSRKISANHTGKKEGSWTVSQIAGEARRDEENSPHVENAKEPVHVAGIPIANLEPELDAYLKENKLTTKSGTEREARSDAHVMISNVYSWPEHVDYYDKERLDRFIDDSLKFHEKEFGRVDSAVLHLDEEFPHIHVYTFDSAAKTLHPGEIAKKEAYAQGADKKVANAAYRDAMKGFQDRFYNDVGLRNGLDRLGPQRQRLSRKEWREQKFERLNKADRLRAAEDTVQSSEKRAAKLTAGIETLKVEAVKLMDDVKANNDRYKEQNLRLEAGQAKIDMLEPKFEKLTSEYDRRLASAKADLKKLEKQKAAAAERIEAKAKEREAAATKAMGFFRILSASIKNGLGYETKREQELKAQKAQTEKVLETKIEEQKEKISELKRVDIYRVKQLDNRRDEIAEIQDKLSQAERARSGWMSSNIAMKNELLAALENYVKLYETDDVKRDQWSQRQVDQLMRQSGFSDEIISDFGLKGFDTIEQEKMRQEERDNSWDYGR